MISPLRMQAESRTLRHLSRRRRWYVDSGVRCDVLGVQAEGGGVLPGGVWRREGCAAERQSVEQFAIGCIVTQRRSTRCEHLLIFLPVPVVIGSLSDVPREL